MLTCAALVVEGHSPPECCADTRPSKPNATTPSWWFRPLPPRIATDFMAAPAKHGNDGHGGPLRWRRRHRGRHCEERLKGAPKRLKQSTGTRSVSADPGGRTEPVHGLKSRYQEWSHPPEPRPPQAGCWCSRFARRPNVRLIWCGNDQIMETGSDLGYRNSDRSFTCATELPLDPDLPM